MIFKVPAGEGEPWKRVLRWADSDAEARIFAQAELRWTRSRHGIAAKLTAMPSETTVTPTISWRTD